MHPMPVCAGHYISLIKSHSQWVFFDDENVESITESQVCSWHGSQSLSTVLPHGAATAALAFLLPPWDTHRMEWWVEQGEAGGVGSLERGQQLNAQPPRMQLLSPYVAPDVAVGHVVKTFH